ncbi:hypothetical protein MIR68_009045 [Amoeboaphelidium protococcarum]|nr:hypothetical protein MIR68_009045 [Amoeboaphelidium protococcarum]KAI3648744.1 hypothetical protein MP228_006598 [Amoeboaphelidium protococcarum]
MTLQGEQQSIHASLTIVGKDGQLLLKKLQNHYQMPNTELSKLNVKTKYFSAAVDVILSNQHQVEDCHSRFLILFVDHVHDDLVQKLIPLLESQDCIVVCRDQSQFDQNLDSDLSSQIYHFNEDFTSIVDALECHLADIVLDQQQQQQQSDVSGDEVEEEASIEIQKDQRVNEQEDDEDDNLEYLVKQARQFRQDYQDKLDIDARHAQAEKLLGKLLSQSGFQFN